MTRSPDFTPIKAFLFGFIATAIIGLAGEAISAVLGLGI